MMRRLLLGFVALVIVAPAREIPSGAKITVRMIDSVDSRSNTAGDLFRASVDEPVVVDGRTILPKGTPVTTEIVEIRNSGRLTGKGELTVILTAVTLNGSKFDARSSEVAIAGKSKTKQSAKRVGGAAVLGAIIGGIAGGGRGAVIGATTAGGAAGTYQVLTKGYAVRIPSETRLTFTLAETLIMPVVR